jgi:hypothetical protein
MMDHERGPSRFGYEPLCSRIDGLVAMKQVLDLLLQAGR